MLWPAPNAMACPPKAAFQVHLTVIAYNLKGIMNILVGPA